MRTVFTLATKDLRLLFRDRFGLFWMLAFPIMFSVFFGSVFGGGGSDGGAALPLALVDRDRSEASAALLERLAGNAAVWVEREPAEAGATDGTADGPGDGRQGALVLSTLDEARELVRKGQRVAFVAVPAGYGASPWSIFAGDGDGGGEQVQIGIDPSRQAEAGVLQGVLMEALFGGMVDRFGDKQALRGDIAQARESLAQAEDVGPVQKLVFSAFFEQLGKFIDDVDPELMPGGTGGTGETGAEPAADLDLAQPFELVDVTREPSAGPRSAFDITFPQALVWGLMSVALGFGITLVRERTAGTLLRLRIAPVSRGRLLAGKALGCYLACLAVMALLLLVGVFAMGVRFDHPGLALLGMLSTAACFTGLSMTIAVMGKTEQAVAGASWGLLMPLAMLGGGMIPLIAMPSWLVTASNISPFKWAILSIEGAAWRGFTLADMALPCAVLVGSGVLFFAFGVAIFSRQDR